MKHLGTFLAASAAYLLGGFDGPRLPAYQPPAPPKPRQPARTHVYGRRHAAKERARQAMIDEIRRQRGTPIPKKYRNASSSVTTY